MRNDFLFLEFSHQTKTVYVGGLEDGIDDPELHTYFSEFGFVTRALRYVCICVMFIFMSVGKKYLYLLLRLMCRVSQKTQKGLKRVR